MSLQSAFRDAIQAELRITIRHDDDSPGFWPAVVSALGFNPPEGTELVAALVAASSD